LIALAETRPGMSGREFLTAAIAGYEIGPRVGICMGPEHIAQGWHSGATVGVYASAAAAARAMKLDADKTVHALGIAGTQSCGLMAAQFGSMVKRMHAGRAAQSGLYAAELADAGFTGILNVFESEYGGFCTTLSRSTDRFKLAELTAGFGSVWQTMNVAPKFYSCVGSNHSTLDAIRELQAAHPLGAQDVEKIVVHGSQVTVEHVGWTYVPQGFTAAQLNLSYCVATLLLDGEVFVDQFTEAKLTALATVGFFTEPPTNWKNERLVWLKLRNDAKIGQIRALLAGVELIGHVIESRALPAYRCSRLDEIRNELLALGCELVG